ncbi:MAG TPA: asparagine synthase (glutamine-hydrolyzing) [Thermoanaerobaculia bacterium]|nr:asparagine synthase (glutamine-hydrolyzing) [Thermoanaerobaculia bacterium]
MCGITAIFAYRLDAPPVAREELEAISERMRLRGPDASGTWFSADGRVGLGSRRLAIIDLSADGNQPMLDTAGELVIVFNGEIYNYRELRSRLAAGGATFHSTSDTEVLLQLYRRDGERMVELLRGMFAFAIWDRRTQRMFVARDPYGIKPLYYADDGHTIRLASQVKALLAGGAVSRTRDVAGVAGFYLMGSVPEPLTICESIRAVEAGTSFFVDAGGRSDPRQYYSVAGVFRNALTQQATIGLVEAETWMREFVAESLRYHLVSDVPVGAFLSSGIDSSTLVALAMSVPGQEPLRTVTLSFGEYRNLADDEAPLAREFANNIGTQHVTRNITRSEFLADLPKLLDAMDQPTIDGVNTYFVSKAAAEQGLKVAISGLGGDELFGSYSSFHRLPLMVGALDALKRIPFGRGIALGALKLLRAWVSGNPKTEGVLRYGGTYGGAYLLQRGLYLPEDLSEVMGLDAANEGLDRLQIIDRIARILEPDPNTPFGRVATLEASLYMRNQLLRDTDWASMAHSLEVRTPLVDASLLRQLAPTLLSRRAESKQLFAMSPRPPLPDALRRRKKTGFLVPLREWADLPSDGGLIVAMRRWAETVIERAMPA